MSDSAGDDASTNADRLAHALAHANDAWEHAWSEENARGLTYAAQGEWADAIIAFGASADAAATRNTVRTREVLSLVLSNLAHACYHGGRLRDGILRAQQAGALRSSLEGTDTVAMSRSRSDLAVMLASAGQYAEAASTIALAITAIESRSGDEDSRLIPLLETAARIALTSGNASNAEPYLLRLHALQALYQVPTTSTDALLAKVAKARAEHVPIAPPRLTPLRVTPLRSTNIRPTPLRLTPLRNVSERGPERAPERVPERSAPMRLTPNASPAVAAASSVSDVVPIPTRPMLVRDNVLTITPTITPTIAPAMPAAVQTPEPVSETTSPDTTSPLAMMGMEFELAEDVRATTAPTPMYSPLGFDVEYGTPHDPVKPDFDAMVIAPITTPRLKTPPIASRSIERLSARRMPVVLPTPGLGVSTIQGAGSTDVVEDLNDGPAGLTLRERSEKTKVKRDARKKDKPAGESLLVRRKGAIIITLVALLAIGGAAAWVLTSGILSDAPVGVVDETANEFAT
ncbi:MAG: tetratricopeptide repeat protein [Gemmatimonadaceae bacterium]|nr:tetratricopeptide repeat protein [Gemmatimonadaceae bacterium]